jgi:hypothetical protein
MREYTWTSRLGCLLSRHVLLYFMAENEPVSSGNLSSTCPAHSLIYQASRTNSS